MKSPGSALSFYAVAVIIAVVLGVLFFQCRKDPLLSAPAVSGPTPTPQTLPASPTTAPIASGTTAPLVVASAAPMATPTPILLQDGKTIDYSSGKPVVRDSVEEKAIIAAAVKEMDAAASKVTFGPGTPSTTPTSKP